MPQRKFEIRGCEILVSKNSSNRRAFEPLAISCKIVPETSFVKILVQTTNNLYFLSLQKKSQSVTTALVDFFNSLKEAIDPVRDIADRNRI
jgi:SET domain-containing protein